MIKLSTRRISSFKTCRLQYYYNDILDIEKIQKGDALYIGIVVHAGLEFLYDNALHLLESSNETKGHLRKHMGKVITKTLKDVSSRSPERYKDMKFEFEKAVVLLYGYMDNYFPETDWKVVKTEYPIIFIDQHSGFEISIRLDLIWNSKRGIWIIDHKTAGNVKEYETKILIDDQLSTYILALAYQLVIKKSEHEVQGAIYNLIRKPKIKKRQGDSDNDYFKRLYKDLQERPDFYFMRKARVATQIKLDNYLKELSIVVQEMDRFKKDPRGLLFRSPGQHCSRCQYKELCLYGENMKDLYRKRVRHESK